MLETTVVQLLDNDRSYGRLRRTATDKGDTDDDFEAICQQFGDALEPVSNVDEPLGHHSVEPSTIDR